MSKFLKSIEIVAGPNGSGKTSFAQTYFGSKKIRVNFINADVIAMGLAPGREESAAFRAGRVVLSAVGEAIKKGDRVAFESTLSGKTWVPIVSRARERNYSVTIYFLFLKSVQLNIKRIERRVRLGGHSVPIATVKRRYPRSFQNFWNLYRPLCTDWYVFDNSQEAPKQTMSKKEWETLTEGEQTRLEASFLEKGSLKNGKKKTA